MEAHPEWALLYQDAIAQLWGRRDRYDDPARADYVPPARRWITQVSHSGSVPWPALPPRRLDAGAARGTLADVRAGTGSG